MKLIWATPEAPDGQVAKSIIGFIGRFQGTGYQVHHIISLRCVQVQLCPAGRIDPGAQYVQVFQGEALAVGIDIELLEVEFWHFFTRFSFDSQR